MRIPIRFFESASTPKEVMNKGKENKHEVYRGEMFLFEGLRRERPKVRRLNMLLRKTNRKNYISMNTRYNQASLKGLFIDISQNMLSHCDHRFP